MTDFVYASDGKKLFITRKYAPKLSPLNKRGSWVDAKVLNENMQASPVDVETFLICVAAGTWVNYDEIYKTVLEKFLNNSDPAG
jgi:hypothetical protein